MQECCTFSTSYRLCCTAEASKQILDVIYSRTCDMHGPVKRRIYAFRDNKIRQGRQTYEFLRCVFAETPRSFQIAAPEATAVIFN